MRAYQLYIHVCMYVHMCMDEIDVILQFVCMYDIICIPYYNVYVLRVCVFLHAYDAFLHSRCHQMNSLFFGQHHYLNRAMLMKELYML